MRLMKKVMELAATNDQPTRLKTWEITDPSINS